MTSRTIHIGASFAIVLVAYCTYALLAVPWIEPPTPTPIVRPTVGPIRRDWDLGVLFPDKNAWQVRDAKVINNNNQSLLLWQKYENRGNGWVDLAPLTVIFMPDESVTDTAERLRQAVVMEVPEGANLRFDRPLDLNNGGLGRLIEGKLRGPVKIRSQGKRPDHQDDLLVLTHDVDLSEQRITTPNDVDFRWGLHSGRGRQMEIKLLPRLGPRTGNQQGPNIGGIEQFQLEHVERLHLDMSPAAATTAAGGGPGTPARGSQPAGSPMLGTLSSHGGPIEITCRGPFRFHLIDQVATFRDQVDVQRIQPDGPADHLSCELLSIYFTRPAPHPGAPAKKTTPGFDLQPARMEAQGTPTTLDAPLDHLQARAERLQYDMINGQIYLEDSQEVMLHKDRNEIHAPSLRYTPGPKDHTGQFKLLAAGPGWLRGEMAAQRGQQLEARWREKLEARPQDQNEVISLTGGALLNFQAMGQLEARDIHFWLHEMPPDAAGKSSFQPDRLLAEGNVVGSSPQFASRVQRMEVWFSSAAPLAAVANGTNDGRGHPSYGAMAGTPGPYVPSTIASTSPLPPIPLPPGERGVPAAAGGRQAHLEIDGRLLQARVLLADQQHGELTEVTVVDNVKLRETQTAAPGDLPLLVTGQWLHATEANTPQVKVTVKGEPAHMEGRGMSLTGPDIHIDRGANRLTIEGPGRMEKFLDRDLENRPLSQPGTLKIDWQKGMVFDGRKAHFQDSVNVTANSQLLQTGWLDVYFQQPVSFSDARQQQPPPAVERLICGDGVFVENRTIKAGQQASYDRMQLKNLDLNNITGDFHGDGPGWLVSVSRGGGQGFAMPGGPLAGPGRPPAIRPVGFGPQPPGLPDPNQLTCLHLRFVKSLTGNKTRKDCAFHGQVCAAYAPAQSWTTTLDSDDPKLLGPKAVVLHCDNLEVHDMSPVSGSNGSGNLELTALDNVIAEGTNFTARSARLTYTQAKDLLILEGDGRSEAELFKQDGGEGTKVSRFAAQKILYFLKTGQANVEGVRSLEMPMNQAPSRPTAPARR